jgi:hypothetical protein
MRAAPLVLILLASVVSADKLPEPLGPAKLTRKSSLVTGFDWQRVAPNAQHASIGGWAEGRLRVDGCGDDPGGAPPTASIGEPVDDRVSQLTVTITKAEPAGKSGRGWPGNRCSFRIEDPHAPERHVELDVPAFNTIKALLRDGDDVFIEVGWNGYAKEVGGKGNYVVDADLASHTLRWRSADMSSNAGLLLVEDYLIIGYGFTKEQASLTVLDRKSGAVAQRVPLPKAPDAMRLRQKTLYVRIYDGWAELPWCPQGCGQ